MIAHIKRITHGTQVPWVTALLTATLVLVQVLSPTLFTHLVYDRAAILDGQIWRLVTGHLVHLDWNHLSANAAALFGLGWLVETAPGNGRKNLVTVLVASIAVISALLMLFAPATAFYAGLSGALNGLFAFACLQLYGQTRHKAWLVLILGAAFKIGWESAFGPLFTSSLAWPSQTLAHFGGLLAGLGLATGATICKARKSWYFPWAHCPFIAA